MTLPSLISTLDDETDVKLDLILTQLWEKEEILTARQMDTASLDMDLGKLRLFSVMEKNNSSSSSPKNGGCKKLCNEIQNIIN